MINPHEIDIIAPSLGKRFSGINASMLAVIPEQLKLCKIAAMGFNVDFDGIPKISFSQFIFNCWRDKWRIWHARRNIDMLIGLILRYVFRYKLILIFTSVAQRKHSWITRFYYHRMKAIIAPTKASASYLDRDAVIVSHGVNTERFYPPKDRSNEWKKKNLPGKFGIGIFGRIRESKGSEDFIDAVIQVLPKNPEWTAVIIGQATAEQKSFEEKLKDKIIKAGLEERVIFMGFLKDSDEIPNWYRSLDIVVCASHTEGFGLPCLEAMASRCSVIATKTGAWPEVIEDGKNAFIINCKSSEEIADRLSKLTSDQKLRENISYNALETVQSKYKIENEAMGIQAVYDGLFKKYNVSC